VNAPAKVLHVFATLGIGGPQLRAVQLMAAMGAGSQHEVLAMDGDTAALARLPGGVACRALPPLPAGGTLATVGRLRRLLRERRPELLLTYNWGAIEAVWAARLAGIAVVHHEDGFLPDEVERRKWRRTLLRRLLLPGVAKVIVPSAVLAGIAEGEWRLRPGHVLHLPNGVDLQRFAPSSRPAHGPCVIGTVGGLRPEKDHRALLLAFAAMRQPARLLFVGDGPLAGALASEVARLGLSDRVEFAGAVAEPAAAYARMDVFALSSRTEQMPLSLLEAMASGLPVVSTDVGDVRLVLPTAAAGGVVPRGEPLALAAALDALVADPRRRAAEGAANRARCAQQYALAGCLDRFLAVYSAAARRGGSGCQPVAAD
jgi:glycosyltransferase involved in cell wall biosynthesis